MAHEAILALLSEMYPDAKPALHFTNPYETMVATILSAQCTDARVNMVTPAVFRDFPDVAAMAAATPEILFPYVRSCGFHTKAENIVNACRMIMERFGGEVPSDMDALTSLPGVGRKTANVIRAFAFGIPSIPVDTHVFRVANRLGLAQGKTPEAVERQLMQVIPREQWNDSHHWMIYHGRQVCHAQRPDCEHCRLRALCAEQQKGE